MEFWRKFVGLSLGESGFERNDSLDFNFMPICIIRPWEGIGIVD